MKQKGIFITFEGMDGSGKTTQMHRLADRLRALGRTVLVTTEPGGPPIAQKIRRIILDAAHSEMSPVAEVLLYFASRAQNVDEWIRPALDRGEIVLSDRFTDSSRVYQGVGRGLGVDTVLELDRIACRGLKPDLTVLVDVDAEASVARARARNAAEPHPETRLDDEAMEFHRKVHRAYHELAAAEPERVRVVDGRAPIDEIESAVWEVVRPMFDRFHGNRHVAQALEQMVAHGRLAQTLLFAGPEGVGKATLARRLAQRLLPHPELIEKDDLSLAENAGIVAAREKWPADKRNEDPLLFASHPDFVTFPPDGPLRQISIQQTRLLKERAQFLPHQGKRRVFLIDHVDRANEQAANSLLKTLEEPPDHMVLVMTAENAYDLLPTIRSRAVPFQFAPLSAEEMREFARTRTLDEAARRIQLAGGSPGVAASLDLESYDRRRAAMLVLLKAAAGAAPFATWVPVGEAIGRSKSEKLELHLKVLYDLLRDLLVLSQGSGDVRNQDIGRELEALAARVEFAWIRKAVAQVDELAELLRRNIQKSIALDALILNLRAA